MEYRRGEGEVITGEEPEQTDRRVPRKLAGPDMLAVSTLGMLAENPRVVALREFISGWHLSYLSADAARGNPEAGGEEQLSSTGANLANVVQYLYDEFLEEGATLGDLWMEGQFGMADPLVDEGQPTHQRPGRPR